MTREEIKRKLTENPDWELPDDATNEEWNIYDEVRAELEGETPEKEEENNDDGYDW